MKINNRSGTTLLEILLVGTLVAGLMGTGLKLYAETTRFSAVSHLAYERLAASRALDEQLREVIRQGEGIAQTAGNYTAGEHCLVLRLPSEGDTERRAVIATAAETRHPFIAILREESGVWTAERFTPFPQPVSFLEFDTSGGRLLLCRYRLALERGERGPQEGLPVQSVYATLRGVSAGDRP